MTNEKKHHVPKTAKPKYQPPQVIQLIALNEGSGLCKSGSSDYISCQSGNSAGVYCTNGPGAGTSCNTGDGT